MTTPVFNKIKEGLEEALAIAKAPGCDKCQHSGLVPTEYGTVVACECVRKPNKANVSV